MSKNKGIDADYTSKAVDRAGRKSNLSMFMVMLGFTFFSASMWAGQNLAAGLDFWGFIWALLIGGLILKFCCSGEQVGMLVVAGVLLLCGAAAVFLIREKEE